MASGVFTNYMQLIADGTIDLLTVELKVMLLDQTPYVYTASDEFVEQDVQDMNETEITADGYVGGFNGADRLVLGSKAITEDDPNDKVIFDSTANLTYSALGPGGTNVGSCGIIDEVATDLDSFVAVHIELPDTTLTGADFTIVWNSGGIIEWDQTP